LDQIPPVGSYPTTSQPSSPTGWSDLPSDAEDTFFFSPEETEDYHREKRRRLIDESREARLKALRAEEDPDEAQEVDPWGGSDEEPDEAQHELMRRTAAHVYKSPNPAHLEMRILANHGADRRFGFLRGRWSRAWRRLKLELAREEPEEPTGGGLGGLTGYGDSDDSGNEGDEIPINPVIRETPHGQVVDRDEEIKKARRARAREWAEKRRAMKAQNETSQPLPQI